MSDTTITKPIVELITKPAVEPTGNTEPSGKRPRAWPEADEDRTDRETVIGHLLAGQHSNPVQVIAFDVAQGWCRDVSEDIANELADLIAIDGRDVPTWLEDFIEEHAGSPTNSVAATAAWCGLTCRWSSTKAAPLNRTNWKASGSRLSSSTPSRRSIRGIVERNWPHLIAKLPPKDE